MWCPSVIIRTPFQNQGDVLARPKVLGAVQASDPQSRAASRHHQRFAFAINFHWQLWLISGEGDMNMMFSESNLVRNIFSKMSEISVIYTVQILPRTDKASVNGATFWSYGVLRIQWKWLFLTGTLRKPLQWWWTTFGAGLAHITSRPWFGVISGNIKRGGIWQM